MKHLSIVALLIFALPLLAAQKPKAPRSLANIDASAKAVCNEPFGYPLDDFPEELKRLKASLEKAQTARKKDQIALCESHLARSKKFGYLHTSDSVTTAIDTFQGMKSRMATYIGEYKSYGKSKAIEDRISSLEKAMDGVEELTAKTFLEEGKVYEGKLTLGYFEKEEFKERSIEVTLTIGKFDKTKGTFTAKWKPGTGRELEYNGKFCNGMLALVDQRIAVWDRRGMIVANSHTLGIGELKEVSK